MIELEDIEMTTYDYDTHRFKTFGESPSEKAAREYRNILTVADKSPTVKQALEQLLMVYQLAKDPNDPDLEQEPYIDENLFDDVGTVIDDDYNRLVGLYDIATDKEDFDIIDIVNNSLEEK